MNYAVYALVLGSKGGTVKLDSGLSHAQASAIALSYSEVSTNAYMVLPSGTGEFEALSQADTAAFAQSGTYVGYAQSLQ